MKTTPEKLADITNQLFKEFEHKNALIRANESLKRAIFNIEQDSLDLISIDIKQAYIDIGEITGNTTSEEIIDAIFSKFCLGK
jgi:tRNA modification GTPase